jgi:hypothetical protein
MNSLQDKNRSGTIPSVKNTGLLSTIRIRGLIKKSHFMCMLQITKCFKGIAFMP